MQRDWLVSELELAFELREANETKFIVVAAHKPLYSSRAKER